MKSQEINITGGARIGISNATWPFITLKVTKNKLSLYNTIYGNLYFKAEDIESIAPYRFIPIIAQGIKINHKVPGYKQKIIFWTFKNPDKLINEIKRLGFYRNRD